MAVCRAPCRAESSPRFRSTRFATRMNPEAAVDSQAAIGRNPEGSAPLRTLHPHNAHSHAHSRNAGGIPQHVHLVGVGGAGVSGLARLLAGEGHRVSGSDREPSRFSRALEELGGHGVRLRIGPSQAQHMPAETGMLVRSAAVPDDDPQLLVARERGLPILKYAEFWSLFFAPERTLAAAGTHGKTTSAWMLFHALEGLHRAGLAGAPGALIGGWSSELDTNAVLAASDGWYSLEACEYDRSFLNLNPRGAIVTNVEGDHLDYYGSLEAIEEAFSRFADGVHREGLLVCGREVPERVSAAASCPVWTLGRELEVDLLGERRGRFGFRLRGPGWATPPIELRVPGAFNVENAALAIALAVGLSSRASGSEPRACAQAAARAVAGFGGAERRFQSWGEVAGISVVHDYAHHPTEVRATLETARRVLPGRPLYVLFQPHQHSRTARFLGSFVESLRGTERVVVAPVYGARAHIDTRKAGSRELAQRLAATGVDTEAPDSLAESVKTFVQGLPERAAALILGAGDVDTIQTELLDQLALRSPLRGGSLR